MQPIVLKKTITAADTGTACNFLSRASGLPKTRIKHAMALGAVWLQRRGRKKRRLRRATAILNNGDRVALYYDETILNCPVPKAVCLQDYQHYSIWHKPAGLMTQGTRFGDHCSLQYQVERYFKPPRECLLAHRLDRETAGLIIIPHTRAAAAQFSDLLRHHKIEKRYQARLAGEVSQYSASGKIDHVLNGKAAVTRYRLIRYDRQHDESVVEVQIVTGRLHQIRRHFDMIGFPVVGDPLYGSGNKNKDGLQLVATALAFTCPFSGKTVKITSRPDQERLF